MGKINNALNRFFRDKQEFADILNLCVYQGQEVVVPEELSSEDTTIYSQDHNRQIHEIRNDVSKYRRKGQSYQLFCLENESKTSYTMPVRILEYEAGRYMEQIRQIAAGHEKTDYHSRSEWLSRFTEGDRLFPVVTLVLYWQEEPWEGKKSLLELLDLEEEEKRYLEPFLLNYRLNLVNMYELFPTDACKGQLKHVLNMLRDARDKEVLREKLIHNPEYQDLKPDTGRVVDALLNMNLEKSIEQKEKEGGTLNMCRAWEELLDEMRCEGIAVGEQRNLIKMICRKQARGKMPEEIAEELEEPMERVILIYDVAKQYAPEYDVDKICEDLYPAGEPASR